MSGLQSAAGQQFEAIKAIPGAALGYWPAFFTFSLVEYLEGMVISAIPNPGGTAGIIINSGLRGMTRVVQMVTWEAVKSIPQQNILSGSMIG